ncbi:hypothetical protein F5Y09DRAFT_303892 [Xylaria sp. FL1042]|nr:hypothetical protein F5Y09DRAFT_303892 [Xylaria sp. FL1042]
MDVVGRLRGEEKASRRYSRGKKEPLPCLLEDVLGVETNDLGGDEPKPAPELALENILFGERGLEALDKTEGSMVMERHAPKEAPQYEALAESFPSKELDDRPTDGIIREADFANDFDPGLPGVLIAHTPSDALSLSIADVQTDIRSGALDVTQHPSTKEYEAKDLHGAEDLECLVITEPNLKTASYYTLGSIPVDTEVQAVHSISPDAEVSLETPYGEPETQPAESSSTLDTPYLNLQSRIEHDDPNESVDNEVLAENLDEPRIRESWRPENPSTAHPDEEATEDFVSPRAILRHTAGGQQSSDGIKTSTSGHPDDTQHDDSPEPSVQTRSPVNERDIGSMGSVHEPTEGVVSEKDSFIPLDFTLKDNTTRATEDPRLINKLAQSDTVKEVNPSSLENSLTREGNITYGAADIELPPSPSLSQTYIDLEPFTTNINARSKNSTVGAESSSRGAVHELYYLQDKMDEAVIEHVSRTGSKNRPFMINDAETSAWETVDEDETSEQVWETTDDDETMERSGGDFRLTREQHTLSDISEVGQEHSESLCNSPINVEQDVTRDFKPLDDLSHNKSTSNFQFVEDRSVEALVSEMPRNALRIGSLDMPHQQSSSYWSMPLETHDGGEGSSVYVIESIQEAGPLKSLHDKDIRGRHSPNAVDGKEPQKQFVFEGQIDRMAWGDSKPPARPEISEFQPHCLDTITEGSDDEFIVQKLGATNFVDGPEQFYSPTPSRPTASFLNDDPLEGISHESPIEHSSDEARVGPFTTSPTQTAILDASHVVAGNEPRGWPATLEDADDSEVEAQRLPHLFDYTRFVSESSPTSKFGEPGHRSFDEQYEEEMIVPSESRRHDISHFGERFGMGQGAIEVNQQISRDGFYWSSTRSSSVDKSNQMSFEPLLDDERLGTIDDTFAPTKALAAGQVQGQNFEDASISDLELRPASSSEAHKIGLTSDLHSFRNAKAPTGGDDRGLHFRFESLLSDSFDSPGVDLLNQTFFERRPIPPRSNKRPNRPILVHSSTQTDDEDFPRGSPSLQRHGLDEEPRSPTPAIVLPDLNDPKVKALGRAKSLKKKRRQHFREVEETVATAVVIYATAQELSPPPSPPRSYGQINKNITETLGAAQGPVQVSSDVVSSEISAEHSVDESDFSPTVADLSTDDERPHRHRSHRSQQHSSRSKDNVSGDEHRHHHHHRHHHRSKDDSGQSLKTSSDRSISSRQIKEDSRRHDSGHEGSHGSSQRRRRTPEEQAAHDKRKEERRARRELDREKEREQERNDKSKEAKTTSPTSDRHSPRSSRRSGHSDLRPGPSHSERRVSIKEEPSPVSNKKFFDFRRGESILDASRVSPEAEDEAPRRTSTSKSHSRSYRESGDSPRAHRTQREHREPRESRESREQKEHREHREHRERREHREHREPRESSDAPRPRSSRHHDEPREESSRRHRERSSRAKVDEDPKISARSMPESEGRISTRSRADSAARLSTRSRGDSDSRPPSSSHKPRSSNSKDEHHRHTSRREERQRERDAEKKKRETPPSGFKGMFKKLFA